ncbi:MULTISPECIES: tetratricopeptide repeat protein [Okeania]|uniref:Tetratricopeptide repeat protein n=1 Tax=Okeania hirsuta TaxID=1458930 RepID=A0A3N6RKV0_9CYAN|nr:MULTISPECIES: tetratricopeptide repeat protein [Okeania]NES92053.1 tetratricopeptide repeat protein [Okeania sp. SIO2B9]RQH36635.1 tetratricopeptide repeat protein [Okeania hirsuta]
MVSYKLSGGGLSANDPTYVMRKQDAELYEKLQSGEYCYVFNARQMGKSSLRVKVMKKLRSQGCKCAAIDMSRLGDFSIQKQSWYDGFLEELFRGFGLAYSIDYQSWIESYQSFTNIQRLARFIEEILFVNFSTEKIYIFLDEIDLLVNLPFKNEFLAFIRSCYNRRAEDGNSDYHRLIFCFFGVATPEDLIRDGRHTPFNIGHPIELTALNFQEGKNLTQGLIGIVEEPEIVLRRVFDWTGGQPFLTQKLCQIIVDHTDSTEPDIDKLVEEHILTYWQEKDYPTHLTYIRHHLLSQNQLTPELLKLYRKILLRGGIKTDESRIQMVLRLSGIVIKKQDKLVVFNKIYRTIFNLNWIEEQLAILAKDRDKQTPKKMWMRFVYPSLIWGGVISLLALGWRQQKLELHDSDRLMQSQIPLTDRKPPPPRFDERGGRKPPPPRFDERGDRRPPPPRFDERGDRRPSPRFDQRGDRRHPPHHKPDDALSLLPLSQPDKQPPPPRFRRRGDRRRSSHHRFAEGKNLKKLAQFYSQEEYKDAEPLLHSALAINEKALGTDHPDIEDSLNNLAALYYSQGKYTKAEPILQRVLTINEKALGTDHPHIVHSLYNLAQIYSEQGRYAEAELLLERALTINEKTFGVKHRNVAHSLKNLADLYYEQGKYKEAELFQQRALDIREH